MPPPVTSTKSVTLTAGTNLSDTRCYLKGSQGELYEATLDLSDTFIDFSTKEDFVTRVVQYAPLGFALDCDEKSSLCSVTWNSTSRSIFYQDKTNTLREWRLVDGKGWQKTAFEQAGVMMGTNVASVPGISANSPPLLFYQDRTGYVCYRTMPITGNEDSMYSIDATQIARGSPLTGIGACVEDQRTIRIYYQDDTLAVRESCKGRYGGWIQTRELVAKRDMIINDIVTFTPVLNGSREIRLYMQDANGTVIECKRARAAWECVSLTTKAMTSANVVAACWLSPKPRIGVLWISGDRHLYICDNEGGAGWREPLPLILLELKKPKGGPERSSTTPFDQPASPPPSAGNSNTQPSNGNGTPSLQPPPPLNKNPSRRGWGGWGGWGTSSDNGSDQPTGAINPASDAGAGPAAAAPQGDTSLRKPSPGPEKPTDTTTKPPGSAGGETQHPARQQPPAAQPLAPQPTGPQASGSRPPSAQPQTQQPATGPQPTSQPKNGGHGPEKQDPPPKNGHQGKRGSAPPKPIYGGAGDVPVVQEPEEVGTEEHGSEHSGVEDKDEDDDTPIARRPTKHKPTQQPSVKPQPGTPPPVVQEHGPEEEEDDDVPTLRKPSKHAPGTQGTAQPKPGVAPRQHPSQGAPATNGGRKPPQRKPTIAVPIVVSPTEASGPAGELRSARAIARVCVAVNVRVNGIRLVYTDGSETAWRGTDSGTQHVFALAPGEHITHVWYATDRRCIEGVLFGTSRGRKSAWFGQEYGLYGLMVNEGHVVDDLLGGSQEGQLNTLMSEWALYTPSSDIDQYRARYAVLEMQCTQFASTVTDWERQIASSRDGLDHLDTAAVAAKLEEVVAEVKLRRELELGKEDRDSEIDALASREKMLGMSLKFVRTAADTAEAAFRALADVLAPVSGKLDASSASKRTEGITLRAQLVRLSEELQEYLREIIKSVSILGEEEQLWTEEVKLSDATLTQDRRVFDKNLAAKKVKSIAPNDKDAPLWGLQEWCKQLKEPGVLETALESHVATRLVKSSAQWQYDTSHIEFLQRSQQQQSAGKTEAEAIRVQIATAIKTLDRVIASIDTLQPNGSAIFQGAQELVELVNACSRDLKQFQHIDEGQKLAAILVSMLNSLVGNTNFKWGKVDAEALLKVSTKAAASEN